jgi:long-chain fatty acid transport protein
LDYYYSTAELRQQYPWSTVGFVLGLGTGFPDGSVTVQGKGGGFGFNTGILFQPLPEHSIGLTYRSQVVVKYSNRKAELTNIPLALQAAFPAGTGDVYATGAKTSIRYPDIVGLGYAFKPSKDWVWELGGQWTNWDDVRSLDIDLDRPTALFPNSSTRLDWRNSFVIRTGVERQCSDSLSLSGGYFFDKSPTNEATYSPLVPDGDHHVFSVGAKYKINDLVIRIPLVGILQTGTGSINSSTADSTGTQNTKGKYGLYGFQVSVGIIYQFGS